MAFDIYYSDGNERGYLTEIVQCSIVSFHIILAL